MRAIPRLNGKQPRTVGPPPRISAKRVKTPTVLQMEAVECGAASLAIVLAYFGKTVPLEELRIACGVSRDGSKALNIVKAARHYGLIAKGYRKEPAALREIKGPMIVHWNFNHFLVVEGFKKGNVFVNDPATGPRTVSEEQFDQAFTGVVLTFEPSDTFTRSGDTHGLYDALVSRLSGTKHALIFAILAGLLLVFTGLVVPIFTKLFVDEVLMGSMSHWLMPLLIGMGITAAFRAMLTLLQEYVLLRMETKIAMMTSTQYLRHALKLPMEFFTQRFGGEIGHRVMLNDRIAALLSGELATSVISAAMIAFYLIIMMQYSLLLTAIGVITAGLNFIFLRLMSRVRTDQNMRLLQEQGKLHGFSMSGLQMIETLKASGAESDFFAKWAGYQVKLLNSVQALGKSDLLLSAVPTLLSALNTTVMLLAGGWLVMNGSMSIGMLVAFQSLMASFIAPVNRIVQLGGTIQEAKGGMNRLDDVIRYPAEAQEEQPIGQGNDDGMYAKLSGFVELRNVTFGYSRLEPPLIESFSMKLNTGSRIALVGGSGSGKSTIAKLVAGIYQPWSGDILFDGKPRSAIPRSVIHHSLAVVDQNIHLFEGKIFDNLTMWDASIPEADVVQAAKDAFIHDEIMSRSGGYNHRIAESGSNFSGGQRQRMAIARALAGNPAILVLDEATSALDPVSEQRVEESIRLRGCTCIITAHRLSAVRDADEIIVMDKGKIVQRGTHSQLIRADGPYAALMKLHEPERRNGSGDRDGDDHPQ